MLFVSLGVFKQIQWTKHGYGVDQYQLFIDFFQLKSYQQIYLSHQNRLIQILRFIDDKTSNKAVNLRIHPNLIAIIIFQILLSVYCLQVIKHNISLYRIDLFTHKMYPYVQSTIKFIRVNRGKYKIYETIYNKTRLASQYIYVYVTRK